MHQADKSGSTGGGESFSLSDVDVGKRPRTRRLPLAILLVVVAALLAWGIWSRISAGKSLRAEAAQVAVSPVSVVSPKLTAQAQEVVLPGNVQPFISSPVYSRTDGYLRKWYVDIGARVKHPLAIRAGNSWLV